MGIDATMYVKTKEAVTEADIKQWSYELGDCFGPENFGSRPDHPRRALQIVQEVYEDSERGAFGPQPGETFINVNLFTRFYGRGYERGNLPFILNVSMWLRHRIPGAEVYYGGDSSGVRYELLDVDKTMALWMHFIHYGHRPYTMFFGRSVEEHSQMCTFCEMPMFAFGWGPKGTQYHCPGCSGERTVPKEVNA